MLLVVLDFGCGAPGSPATEKDGAADGQSDAQDGDARADGAIEAEPAQKPLPVPGAGSRVIVGGAVALIGSGPDSCTNQVSARGDRWCGFARETPAGLNELWVFDATRAAAGDEIACDGSDARCLRLSGGVFTAATNGWDATGAFKDSRFEGDTLIYEETTEAGPATSPFLGAIWAWRPGWTAGRKLTSDTGLSCRGRSDAVLCVDNPRGALTEPLTVDLHAGRLSAATGPLLPTIDTLLLAAATDEVGATPRFQIGLSPDGAYALWSVRPAADGVETLKALALGDAAAQPFTVAEDVSQWTVSPDGQAWYWLAAYNYDVSGAPAGRLQTAPFPGGQGAATLAAGVADFSLVPGGGLSFRADVGSQVGTLKWMADPRAPDAVTTVDTNVLAVFDQVSGGQRFVYAKTFTALSLGTIGVSEPGGVVDLVDFYAGSATGEPPCVLADQPRVARGILSASGGLALWERFDPATGIETGFDTSLATCTSTTFAPRLWNVVPFADRGYLYLEDHAPDADEATLRYAAVTSGALVVAAAPLQTRAASVVAPLPASSAVLYTVSTWTAADGLYLNTTALAEGAAP
jgi:hypothetical protein